MAATELGEGAVDLAVEHGFVADELEEVVLGRERIGEDAAGTTETLVTLGGFEPSFQVGDFATKVLNQSFLGVAEGLKKLRIVAAGVFEVLEEFGAGLGLGAWGGWLGLASDEEGPDDLGVDGRERGLVGGRQ